MENRAFSISKSVLIAEIRVCTQNTLPSKILAGAGLRSDRKPTLVLVKKVDKIEVCHVVTDWVKGLAEMFIGVVRISCPRVLSRDLFQRSRPKVLPGSLV
jgi:hypothetical protein